MSRTESSAQHRQATPVASRAVESGQACHLDAEMVHHEPSARSVGECSPSELEIAESATRVLSATVERSRAEIDVAAILSRHLVKIHHEDSS